MSEKCTKKEYKGHKLRICWGRPPEFEICSSHICSVYVESKTDKHLLFTERTHISLIAEKLAENLAKKESPGGTTWQKLLIEYTFRKAKGRIESGDYEKEAAYSEEILNYKLKNWLNEVQSLFDA